MNNITKLTAVLAVVVTVFGCIVITCDEYDAAGSLYVGGTGASDDNAGTQNAPYATLSAAFTAADDGDTIILQDDISECPKIELNNGKSYTLNLNNHTISFSKDSYFLISNATLDVTGNGTVKEGYPYNGPFKIMTPADAVAGKEYVNLTIGADVTAEGWAPVFISFDANAPVKNAYGVTVNVYGTLNSVRDTSGYGGHGIYLNGSITTTEDYAIINVYDGAKITSIGNGAYIAGYAEFNMYGGSISGETGIEIRAGALNVFGGTITSTSDTFSSDPNGNGSTTVGVGIAVSQHTTDLPISANVSGGQISGMYALYQTSKEEGNNPSIVNIDISGGTFTCTTDEEGYYAVYSEDKTSFVTGGTFNGGVDESLIAPGVDFAVNPDGSIGVGDDIVKDEPSNPSYDDDELPPFIPTQPKDSGDDVTIVACAAAAVVAALMAVFLIVSYKKE